MFLLCYANLRLRRRGRGMAPFPYLPPPPFLVSPRKFKIETENHVFRKSTSRLRRVKITENIFPSMLEGGEREGGRELFILRGAARTLFVKQTGRNVARVIFKKGIPIRKLFFALPFFFPSFSFFSFFLFESFRTLVLFSFFFLILKLINERGNLEI